MNFAAVIFDLDGTLIDSERAAMTSGVAAFETLGYQTTTEFLHQLVGKDRDSGAKIIQQAFSDIDLDALDAAWRLAARAHHAEGIETRPGANELISRISELPLPSAVATSSQLKDALFKLHHSGLQPHFDIVVSANCVTRRKPWPDPFLLAAERLGVSAPDCIVFEDTDTGAEAARAAGMRVVQVPDLLPTDGRHADHVAPSLLEGARMAGLI